VFSTVSAIAVTRHECGGHAARVALLAPAGLADEAADGDDGVGEVVSRVIAGTAGKKRGELWSQRGSSSPDGRHRDSRDYEAW
jgi:hypothetical protein